MWHRSPFKPSYIVPTVGLPSAARAQTIMSFINAEHLKLNDSINISYRRGILNFMGLERANKFLFSSVSLSSNKYIMSLKNCLRGNCRTMLSSIFSLVSFSSVSLSQMSSKKIFHCLHFHFSDGTEDALSSIFTSVYLIFNLIFFYSTLPLSHSQSQSHSLSHHSHSH